MAENPDKPTPTLIRGDRLTAQTAADFYRRLTGKDVTPEGMARLRALLDKSTPK